MNAKQKREIFLETYRKKACNVSQACKAAGIARRTYNAWIEKNKKFAEQVKEIEEALLDFAESQLMQNIQYGRETSLIFFLKTKGKSRGYIEGLEHSGKVGIEVIDPFADAED